MVECKDSNKNLRKILDPVKDQINALNAMTWNHKNLRVFLFWERQEPQSVPFRDNFLLKLLYGISGAQSFHPCLWCEASKEQTQKSSTEQPAVVAGTVSNRKE